MDGPKGGGCPSKPAQHFGAFPYPPYSIQQQFMAELYQTLERGEIGLFESPTGECGGAWQKEQGEKEGA